MGILCLVRVASQFDGGIVSKETMIKKHKLETKQIENDFDW